jgi:hypothetical protein
MIWAYSQQDAEGPDSFNKHQFGMYGARSVMLLEPPAERGNRMQPGVRTLDLTFNNVTANSVP